MSNVPDGLRYSAEHEWIATTEEDGVVRIGITDFAQDALGDVVYVDLPESGTEITAGSTVGEVESTKSVSDIYAPVTGTVKTLNEELEGEPGVLNSDPYGAGWLMEVTLSDANEVDSLLDADGYREQVG